MRPGCWPASLKIPMAYPSPSSLLTGWSGPKTPRLRRATLANWCAGHLGSCHHGCVCQPGWVARQPWLPPILWSRPPGACSWSWSAGWFLTLEMRSWALRLRSCEPMGHGSTSTFWARPCWVRLRQPSVCLRRRGFWRATMLTTFLSRFPP